MRRDAAPTDAPTDDTAAEASRAADPTETVAASAVSTPRGPLHRIARASGRRARSYVHRNSFTGTAVAVVFWWLSLTPSLLPRTPLFQGVVSGAAAATGYAVGAFFAWLARYLLSRDTPWRTPRWYVWLGLAVVYVVGSVIMLYWFSRWQNEIRDLMGVPHLRWTAFPATAVVALIVHALLMTIGQGWADIIRWLTRQLNKIAPPRISVVSGVTVVVVLTGFLLNGVVANYAMNFLNSTFASANDETTADSTPPTTPLRSGGPGSLVSWNSLGREGRVFISHGPSVEALSEFNRAPAIEPIRVFVGLGSGSDLRANAKRAADELERTGGLTRRLIAVGSATGSGWTNKAMTDSLEYMYNGDVATVSMQYSYLPSWISFLADKQRARRAGLELFEAIDAKVRAVPESRRPKIVVFGESLGSFAGESAFGTIPSVTARTDGALFSGPTFNNTLWKDLTNSRDKGSPEWLPIYERGGQVRFIADQKDLERPSGPWSTPRVVYLQHASDPIAWWNPKLILSEPDWLKESRGRDVVKSTRWIPFVTFLQVSADLARAVSVPDGHGHNYLTAVPYAWAAILQPPGWTEAKTEALLPRLTRD
ncbi:alpha/beta hydrolase [Williamsia sp. CHRR-6]|uniref:alpha/beta hydrolase n=1 Tax=Williamsia sp. CHRR-6 TaxID=2835871 RepID=UPI0035AE2BB4